MALLLNRLFQLYKVAMVDWADPRTKNLPLVESPIKLVTILAAYLIFCLKLGPKFMQNRAPFNMKNYIIVYNIFQILYNVGFIILATPYIVNNNWRCSLVDYKNEDRHFILVFYSYFFIKLVDLLDTVFFVLKKNQRQITFLHVYHHCIMVFMLWIGVKYHAGGHSIYVPYFNTIIHSVMYFYYLLCALNEKHKKNVWWKKHLTQLQLVQFLLICLVYSQLLFRDCAYSRILTIVTVLQSGIIACLFLDFYYKSYILKKKSI